MAKKHLTNPINNHYCFSSFCLEELVGNSLLKGLEYGTGLPYVVSLEGTQCPTFEDIERSIDMMKNLMVRTLFEWSRIWGLTHCSSLSNFLLSIRLSFWFDCIYFKGSEFTIVNTLFLFINKTLIIYKKKEEIEGGNTWKDRILN